MKTNSKYRKLIKTTPGPPHNVFSLIRTGNATMGFKMICITMHWKVNYDMLYVH